MLDKPIIDREKMQKDDERRQLVMDVAEKASRLLGPGETLNRPVRKDDRIIFTVQHGRGTERRMHRPIPSVRERSVRYTAWFENGVI
ncbi:MAG: hypothetical protein WD021_07880 [Rhodothermales bacterium]